MVEENRPDRWVETNWKNQGWVHEHSGHIWYTEVTESGKVLCLSMKAEDWYAIPAEERKPEEKNEDEPRRRYQRARKASTRGSNKRVVGKGSVVRGRSR